MCPACGTPLSPDTDLEIYLVFLFVGVAFILYPLYYAFTGSEFEDILIWIIVVGIIWTINSLLYYGRVRREWEHREYTSKMKPGRILLEERPGYDDNEVRDRWRSRILHGRFGRGNPKNWYPESMYEGLKGNWTLPILSPKDYSQHLMKTEKQSIVALILSLVVGAALLGIDIRLGTLYRFACCWGMSFMFFIIQFAGWIQAERIRKNDGFHGTSATCTPGDYRELITTVREFMDGTGEPYE